MPQLVQNGDAGEGIGKVPVIEEPAASGSKVPMLSRPPSYREKAGMREKGDEEMLVCARVWKYVRVCAMGGWTGEWMMERRDLVS